MSVIPDCEPVSPGFVEQFQFKTWSQFIDHLADRDQKPVEKKIKKKSTAKIKVRPDRWASVCLQPSTKIWGLGDSLKFPKCEKILEHLDGFVVARTPTRKAFQRVAGTDWLTLVRARPIDRHQLAMITGLACVLPELLVAGHTLPDIADDANKEQFTDGRIVGLLNEIAELCHEALSSRGICGVQAVELAMVLGRRLPELEMFAESADRAILGFSAQLDGWLDTDGSLRAVWANSIPAFLATWTRTLVIARSAGLVLSDDCQERWEWFLRFAWRLMRCDGTSMLSDYSVPPMVHQMALSLTDDPLDQKIARALMPRVFSGGTKRSGGGKKKGVAPNEQGTFSEWAGVGVLQGDWSARSPRVAICVESNDMSVEVCRGKSLLRLVGFPDVSLNGKPLAANGSWQETCSHFDDDISFVELEFELQDGVHLERQIGLIHNDQTLWVADSVISDTAERLDYKVCYQVDDHLTTLQETENHEVYLQDKKIRGLLLPVELSEWKNRSAAAHDNGLTCDGNCIELRLGLVGTSLYAPIFLALKPGDSVKPRTWRKLTVAESMQTVSNQVARAYRIRVGNKQWVIYKSFGLPGNRTFLGQNQTCEFFLGSLLSDGNVNELLSLDSGDNE